MLVKSSPPSSSTTQRPPAAVPAHASSTASAPAPKIIVRKTIACFEQVEISCHKNQLCYVTFRIRYTSISTFCITETIIPYAVADEICGIRVNLWLKTLSATVCDLRSSAEGSSGAAIHTNCTNFIFPPYSYSFWRMLGSNDLQYHNLPDHTRNVCAGTPALQAITFLCSQAIL